MDFIERNISGELREALASSRAVALLGARQVGKSTLARRLIETGELRSYSTLDNDALRAAALDDPDGVLASMERPAVIDEIQRAPELLLSIKRLLDDEPDVRGQFLITGSSNLLTNRHVADALPGRVQYLDLWPLSQGEVEGRRESFIDSVLAGVVPAIRGAATGRAEHAERIVTGGYPEARGIASDRSRARFFRSYVNGLLARDLADLFSARTDASSFLSLLRLLAARTGGETNFSKLGSELELGHMAVKRHVEVLAQLFLLRELPSWSGNLGARVVRTPKVYLADPGVAAALAGIDATRFASSDHGAAAGSLLETFVVTELFKQSTWSDRLVELYFYRDKEQREVDVVIEDSSGEIAAVEIKAATSVRDRDLRGLRFLREKLGDRFKAGVLLYTGSETLPFGDRIHAVPLTGLWSGGPGAVA